MKNKNNILNLAILALVIPGAAHAFSQEKDGIKIQVNDFMKNPYEQVINSSNWTITAEDLQKNNIAPIIVKITNNTDKPIYISGRSIKLLQATPEDIAAKFKKREILPPFLLWCINNIVGTGFFGRMLWQEGNNTFNQGEAVAKRWKLDPREKDDFLNDPVFEEILTKYNLDRTNIDTQNPVFKTDEFKADVADFIQNKMDPQCFQDLGNLYINTTTAISTRSFKIIGFFTLTGIGGALAYWSYLRGCLVKII